MTRDVTIGGGGIASAGVRAQAMLPEGKLIDDFHFEEDKGILHVINAPSPGATASLAIGQKISEKVLTRLL